MITHYITLYLICQVVYGKRFVFWEIRGRGADQLGSTDAELEGIQQRPVSRALGSSSIKHGGE